jgi:hypothetical protein
MDFIILGSWTRTITAGFIISDAAAPFSGLGRRPWSYVEVIFSRSNEDIRTNGNT